MQHQTRAAYNTVLVTISVRCHDVTNMARWLIKIYVPYLMYYKYDA